MPNAYRFIEACALLPLLYVSAAEPNTILCLGTHAEKLAADCLRWRDVAKVYLLSTPIILRDKRIEVNLPAAGSCAAVLTSPDEPAEIHTAALKADGVFCASTMNQIAVPAMLRQVRGLFPRAVTPWRDYLPEPIFGALASPRGVPTRKRSPPTSARHLSDKYLPFLFTFAADETPLVFGPPADKKAAVPEVPRAQPA